MQVCCHLDGDLFPLQPLLIIQETNLPDISPENDIPQFGHSPKLTFETSLALGIGERVPEVEQSDSVGM